MKILVLGAGGMAGHVIALYLRENNFVVDTLSAKHPLDNKTSLMDVTDLQKLKDFLKTREYAVIINCIGLLVKESEERKDLAVYLNSFLPRFLENYFRNSQTRIVHLSTDCVFSGVNPPYREDSPYGGVMFYDRTKALGEIINDKDLTFRMSIVGPELRADGTSLFNWFFKQTGEISGYNKVIWSGITTIGLAKAINAAIEQKLTGVYHLVPNASISKFDLLHIFKEVFNRKDITIKPNSSVVFDRTLINTRRDFKFVVPGYEQMVKEMKDWIKFHNYLYPHYVVK